MDRDTLADAIPNSIPIGDSEIEFPCPVCGANALAVVAAERAEFGCPDGCNEATIIAGIPDLQVYLARAKISRQNKGNTELEQRSPPIRAREDHQQEFTLEESIEPTPPISDALLRRPLPQDIEAEMGVLAGILTEPGLLDDVAKVISPTDFYRESHSEIFKAMLRCQEAGTLRFEHEPGDELKSGGVDAISLVHELRTAGVLEAIGGAGYIAELATSVIGLWNVPRWCEIVRECAVKRTSITRATQFTASAYNGAPLQELIKQAQQLVPETIIQQTPKLTTLIYRLVLVEDYMHDYVTRAGMPYIIQELLYQGNFSLLLGRALTGKSSLAAALVRAVALGEPFLGRKTAKLKCAYLALERNGAAVAKLFQEWHLGQLVYFQDEIPAEKATDYIMQEIKRLNIQFLVIDHMQHATRIDKGNDYANVSNALKPYQDITRLSSCGILGLHHQGKPKQIDKDSAMEMDDTVIDALGSEAYRAASDTFMECTQSRGQYFFRAQPRVGSDVERVNIEIDFDTGEVSGNDTHIADIKLAVIRIQEFLLQQGQPIAEKEIREKVEGRTKIISEAIRKALAEGLIRREGEGGRHDPFRYAIALPKDIP